MKFRYARHTNKLKDLKLFYTEVLDLEVLGGFENHDGYDGIFLGKKNTDWHLEFTESKEVAEHKPDADDLLVFYVADTNALNAILEKAKAYGSALPKSKNPYWQQNGIEITDPDGFGVVLTTL